MLSDWICMHGTNVEAEGGCVPCRERLEEMLAAVRPGTKVVIDRGDPLIPPMPYPSYRRIYQRGYDAGYKAGMRRASAR